MKKLVFSILTMSVLQIGNTFAQCQGQVLINGKSVEINTSSFSPGSALSVAAAGLAAERCGQFVQRMASSPGLLSGLIASGSINSTDALKACKSSNALSGGWMFVDSKGRMPPKRGRFSTALNRGNCPGSTVRPSNDPGSAPTSGQTGINSSGGNSPSPTDPRIPSKKQPQKM
jgi:hypothetical protein